MKHFLKQIFYPAILLCSILLAEQAFAQLKPVYREVVKSPANKSKFLIFLLAGQSNMAGRGNVEAQDTVPDKRILTLNSKGQWEVAKEPVHFDRAYAGTGPGLAFARALSVADTSIIIGLVPCAVGGSSINSWLPADEPSKLGKNYLQAIERCKVAATYGDLKGVLWIQGESDCTAKGVINYSVKLQKVVNGFRIEFNKPELWCGVALLPSFQENQPDRNGQLVHNQYVQIINNEINTTARQLKNFHLIQPDETTHRGDYLHYDAASSRMMGQRFAAKYISTTK